jgi:GC-rich sequence DNA-binding factor
LKPLQKSSAASDSLDALGIISEPVDDIDTNEDAMLVDEPLPEMPDDSSAFHEPSVAEIQKIKAKRDRLRMYGSAAAPGADGALERDKDFVALGKDDEDNPDSRLIRDSVFDDDEAEATEALGQDYNGGRVNFGDPGKSYSTKLEQSVKQRAIDDNLDEDDEWRRWETQQILKSGVRRSEADATPTATTSKSKIPTALLAPPATQIPSLDAILDVLEREISDVQTVHVQNKLHLSKTQGNIQEIDDSIDTMQAEYSELTSSFHFFEDMKKYVLDLLDCVGEKMAQIEALEKEWIEISIKRVRAAWRRASQFQIDDKERAKELISGAQPSQEAVLGRMERAAARQRVQARVAIRKQTNEDQNGWMSDEDDYSLFTESDNPQNLDLAFEEETAFATTCREIYKKSVAIFEDVYDDFSDVRTIAERFQEWKSKDPKSYNQTHVPLSLPILFDPFVRLELLQTEWDPMFKSPYFDSMRWYRFLSSYGGENMADDDEDRNLVPNLVEKTVIPRARSLLNVLFDPFSSAQNKRMLTLVEELLVYVAPEKVAEMLSVVRVNLQGLCDRTDLLAISPELLEKHDELLEYESKQLARFVKILENCLIWCRILPPRIILSMVSPVVEEKLVPHFRSIVSSATCISCIIGSVRKLAQAVPDQISFRDSFPVLSIFLETGLKKKLHEADQTIIRDKAAALAQYEEIQKRL